MRNIGSFQNRAIMFFLIKYLNIYNFASVFLFPKNVALKKYENQMFTIRTSKNFKRKLQFSFHF